MDSSRSPAATSRAVVVDVQCSYTTSYRARAGGAAQVVVQFENDLLQLFELFLLQVKFRKFHVSRKPQTAVVPLLQRLQSQFADQLGLVLEFGDLSTVGRHCSRS